MQTPVRRVASNASANGIFGYTIGDRRYLNVTNRCTLRCAFCPKFNGCWTVRDHGLRLRREPTETEMLLAAGAPRRHREIVFCGLGEPTLRLQDVLRTARRLRARGERVRVNTDGLANLVFGRDVTPVLDGAIDALSISLNAQHAGVYRRHCRPPDPRSYEALLDFIRRARRHVPEVTVTAIDGLPGVDVAACRRIARSLRVDFRRRVLDVVG